MPTVTTKHRIRWVNPADSVEHLFDIEHIDLIRPPHHLGAGKMRDRVNIQSVAETRTAHGAVTKTFTTQDTVWAAVKYIQGAEGFQADQVQSEATVEVMIRDMRLTCKERNQDGWRG